MAFRGDGASPGWWTQWWYKFHINANIIILKLQISYIIRKWGSLRTKINLITDLIYLLPLYLLPLYCLSIKLIKGVGMSRGGGQDGFGGDGDGKIV